jgi:hypothetical protein
MRAAGFTFGQPAVQPAILPLPGSTTLSSDVGLELKLPAEHVCAESATVSCRSVSEVQAGEFDSASLTLERAWALLPLSVTEDEDSDEMKLIRKIKEVARKNQQ